MRRLAATVDARWRDRNDFRACVSSWAEKLKVEATSVHLRRMDHKWASCSLHGRITFNVELLEHERAFGEYVIVHELIHLRVKNHGRLFKGLMGAYLPDWKQRAALAGGVENCAQSL